MLTGATHKAGKARFEGTQQDTNTLSHKTDAMHTTRRFILLLTVLLVRSRADATAGGTPWDASVRDDRRSSRNPVGITTNRTLRGVTATQLQRRSLRDTLAQLLHKLGNRGNFSQQQEPPQPGARRTSEARPQSFDRPHDSEHPRDEDESFENTQLERQTPVTDHPYQGLYRSKPSFRNLNQSIRVMLPPPQRLLSLSASAIQMGILIWLGSMIWKAVAEVVEEYSQEINQEDPLLCKREQLDRVMAFLQQNPLQVNKMLQKEQNNDLPPMHILQIAHKLALSGLPLTSQNPEQTTIQSVLSSITKSQANMLQQCLKTTMNTEDMTTSSPWDQIVGLEPIKQRILSALDLTIDSLGKTNREQLHHRAFSSLFDNSAMTGILLYGPPGCGKTLLVKALASSSRLPCLVVAPSVLLRKYVGDTNAQVKALFQLAQLLAPCIVCIDELDGLFRERRDDEHEVSRDLKTEFLQWWDGLLNAPASSNSGSTATSHGQKRIIVIGATNRPFDVDAAVLRRLPQSHFVGLPDPLARSELLKQLLSNIPNDCLKDVDGMNEIVVATERYTPSDIKQVLQTAALMGPMRERSSRPLNMEDLRRALRSTPPTPLSFSYRQALAAFCQQQNSHEPKSDYAFGPNGGSTSLPSSHAPEILLMQPKWETEAGNFYNVGSIHVDHETFDALSALVSLMDSFNYAEDDDEATDHDLTEFEEELDDDAFSDE